MKARIISILLAATFILQLPNLYRNPNFLEENFGVPTKLILILVLAIFAVLRITTQAHLTPLLKRALTYLFLATAPITTLAIILNGFINANLIYGLTRINLNNLLLLSTGVLVALAINLTNSQWKKYGVKLVTFSPLILLFILSLVNLLPFDQLTALTRQDGPAEIAQNYLLLASLIISFLITLKISSKKGQLALKLFFAGVTVALFFLLGEEISWGQFFLGIDTPAAWAAINEQQETTLHNLNGFNSKISYLYFLLAFSAACAPLAWSVVKKLFGTLTANIVLPKSNLVFFFAIVAGYHFYNIINSSNSLNFWPEAIEVFLYAGIFLYLVQNALALKAFVPLKAFIKKIILNAGTIDSTFLTNFTSKRLILR